MTRRFILKIYRLLVVSADRSGDVTALYDSSAGQSSGTRHQFVMYTIICHMYPFCLKMRDTTLTVLDSWCIGRYRSPCSHSYVRHLYGRQNGRQRTDVGREIKFDLRASLSFTRSERTAGAGEGVRGIADVSDVGSKLTAKQVQRPTSLSPQRKTPIRPLTVLSRATNCVYDLVVDRSHRVAAVNSTTDG